MRIIDRYFLNKAKKNRYDQDHAIWQVSLYGTQFEIVDFWKSEAPFYIFKEINRNELKISRLEISSGKIIDIGGHVGIVSIFLSKIFPMTTIYTYEAYDKNYENLLVNIELNKIKNVVAKNLAVTGNGLDFEMICSTNGKNTGGSTGCSVRIKERKGNYTASSVTLDEILRELGSCELLKIDCEGAEHEILRSSKNINKVKNLIGEFHINKNLEDRGFCMDSLEDFVRSKIGGLIAVKKIKMCE